MSLSFQVVFEMYSAPATSDLVKAMGYGWAGMKELWSLSVTMIVLPASVVVSIKMPLILNNSLWRRFGLTKLCDLPILYFQTDIIS